MRIESEHVAIRHVNESDANPLFENYLGDESTCYFLSRHAHKTSQQTLDSIRRWMLQYKSNNPQLLVFAIEERPTQVAIGCLVLVLKPEWAELHFGLSSRYQGRGYATQACQIGLEYLKSFGCACIRTTPHVDHVASIRVLEKVGFVKQGVLNSHAVFPAISEELQDCADMWFVN